MYMCVYIYVCVVLVHAGVTGKEVHRYVERSVYEYVELMPVVQ